MRQHGSKGHAYKDFDIAHSSNPVIGNQTNVEKLFIGAEPVAKLSFLPESDADPRTPYLEEFGPTDPEFEKAGILAGKYELNPELCSWVFKDPNFCRWYEAEDKDSDVFWIRGDAGKGKTMIMAAAAEEVIARSVGRARSSIMAYFFCQRGNEQLSSAEAILKGLLFMLIKHDSDERGVVRYLRRHYPLPHKRIPSLAALWELLQQVLEKSAIDVTYLIVDALDECAVGLQEFLDQLSRRKCGRKIRWLLTSRNELNISESLLQDPASEDMSLEVNSERVSAAVDAFIDIKVDELARNKKYGSRSPTLEEEVRSYLKTNADGTFLWAALVCQQLHQAKGYETATKLYQFPPGLVGLYSQMLALLGREEKNDDIVSSDLCKQILRLTAIACRPQTLDEVATFTDFPEEISSNRQAREEVVLQCAYFLIVRNETVYFVHASSRDYFLNGEGRAIFPDDPWLEHGHLALRSLDLMLNELNEDICDLRDPAIRIGDIPENLIRSRVRPSLQYACYYWTRHFAASHMIWSMSITPDNEDQSSSKSTSIKSNVAMYLLHVVPEMTIPKGIESSEKIHETLRQVLCEVESKIHGSYEDFASEHENLFENFYNFLQKGFLHWLEVLSLLKQVSMAEQNLVALINGFEENCDWWHHPPQYGFLKDALTFVKRNRYLLDNTPLQIYASGLVFSPQTSQIKQFSLTHIPSWLDRLPEVRQEWGAGERVLEGCALPVWLVRFSPCGYWLLSAAEDRRVRIWNVDTGELRGEFQHPSQISDIVFSNRTGLAASYCGSKIHLYELNPEKKPRLIQEVRVYRSVNFVSFSADDSFLGAGLADGNVKTWNIPNLEERGALFIGSKSKPLHYSAASEDARVLAANSCDDGTLRNHILKVWSVDSDAINLLGYESYAFSSRRRPVMAVCSDGPWVAVGGDVGKVMLWNASGGRLIHKTLLYMRSRNFFSFLQDPGGLIVLTPDTEHENAASMWMPGLEGGLRRFKGHVGAVTDVTFSTPRNEIATASKDGTVRLWDCDSAPGAKGNENGHSDRIAFVIVSPDGKTAASGSEDKSIRLWGVANGKCHAVLESVHTWMPYHEAVKFSSDCKFLAIGCKDGTIHVWSVSTCQLFAILMDHADAVTALDFSTNSSEGLIACLTDDDVIDFSRLNKNTQPAGIYQIEAQTIDPRQRSQLKDRLRASIQATGTPNGLQISDDLCWVTWREHRLLWLPVDVRAATKTYAVVGETILLGNNSGWMTFLHFDLHELALLK
ncbi:MAG: hypothetical protein Q9162_000617 [Coniocarpon cinnabarinum]